MKVLLSMIRNGRGIINTRILMSLLPLTLGGIFVVSGINKIFSETDFTSIVISYNLLPNALAQLYGFALPWIELILGSLLILHVASRLASIISMSLILSFIVANLYAMSSGSQIGSSACGCFGESLPLSHTGSLILGTAMLLMATLLVFRRAETLRCRSAQQALVRFISLTVLVIAAVVFAFSPYAIFKQPTNAVQASVYSHPTQAGLVSDINNSLISGKPLFIYAYSDECHYCQKQKPIIDALDEEYGGGVTFVRMNNQQHPEVFSEFNIRVLPTLLLVFNEDLAGEYSYVRFEGLTNKEILQLNLDKYSAQDGLRANALASTNEGSKVSKEYSAQKIDAEKSIIFGGLIILLMVVAIMILKRQSRPVINAVIRVLLILIMLFSPILTIIDLHLSEHKAYAATDGNGFVIAVEDNSNIYYAKSNGDGTFDSLKYLDYLGGSSTRGVTIADFDGDQDFDFIAGRRLGSIIYYYLFDNDGTDNFTSTGLAGTLNNVGSWAMDMTSGDFNNDGHIDFIGNGDSSTVGIFLNTGDSSGNFNKTELSLHFAFLLDWRHLCCQ